ncbi:hypothetical protein, variant [Aphanomyces invadans]|uniref:Nucleoporin Nup54 alpha-helical domain-containing protein n=1 Tax=Aphanomyces invadans TaxID=157072 RepID=A0A024TYB5_9STRA|nr:hypothetical protein, variant [Aphanomyces invadans]ETV98964.1 hypothetical protein, variant [Aphanomyces invadans]|eukprot:XP_008872391.1 hypothetical protein, variant [Aphanomyces invadans]
MFGSTATSFGAPAATTAPATGFSFGQTPSTPASNPPTGGFSFGGAATTPAAAPTTGGGNAFSFGSTTPAQPANSTVSGFSFGGSAPASTAATGTSTTPGFSFGGSSTPAATAGSTTTAPFSFGGSTTPAAPATGTSTGFSFGGSTNPAATTTTTATPFSFGGSTGAPATGASTGFSFGGASTTPAAPSAFSFGSSSGFGNTANNKPTTSAFGFPAATTTSNPANASMNAAAFAAANSPLDSLNGVRMAYTDPFQSRFKHMFYNAVDPSQKHLYSRPPHVGEKLWIQAQRDNPDPANLVPAAVVGFKELSTRIQLQQAHIKKFHGYAKDLVVQVQEMEKASRNTDVKLTQCRQQHIALFHRLVQLMRKLELFKQLRKPLHANEHHLAATLKHVQSLLDNPTQFKAHMHELMTLQSLQAALPTQQRPDAPLTEEDLATVFRVKQFP